MSTSADNKGGGKGGNKGGGKSAGGKAGIDEDLVRTLADILDERGLSEIEYATDDWQIRVAREIGVAAGGPVVAAGAPTAQAAAAAGAEIPAVAEAPPEGAVTSPMVGTVYLAPEPGAAHFVAIGDSVSEGQTLCLIEAMKTFNEIRAPKGGKITAILVENATPVEYDDVLLVVV